MARIVCFTDQQELIDVTRQGLYVCGHTLSALSASSLSDTTRQAVQRIAPDLVLLEISHTLDNPHLFFFLRSDANTRHIPIVLVSEYPQLEQQAAVLGAQGHLQFPFTPEQICHLVQSLLPQAIRDREVGAVRTAVAARPFERKPLPQLRRLPLAARAVGAQT